MDSQQPSRTGPALAARQRYTAERRAADPAQLDRAVRTVQAAIAAGRLTASDVLWRGVVEGVAAGFEDRQP